MREHIARLLGRPQDRVRVIAPDVGGGFGEKGCMYPEEGAIPYLSILLNCPTRWAKDRQENMVAFHGRVVVAVDFIKQRLGGMETSETSGLPNFPLWERLFLSGAESRIGFISKINILGVRFGDENKTPRPKIRENFEK